MKRFSLFIVSAVLAVAIMFGALAVNQAPQAHAASVSPAQSIVGQPTWVQQANPYVKIVNHVASIDSMISQHLNANELLLVQNAVNHYNNLPLSLRQQGTISGSITRTSNGKIQPNACCSYQWSLSWQWWGARVWLNSYAAQNFGVAMGVLGAAIGAAVGAGIGAAPGAVIGAIIGTLSGGAASFVNNECGDRGIYLDINWALVPSFTPVC